MECVPDKCLLSGQVDRQGISSDYYQPSSPRNDDSKEAKESHFAVDLKLSKHRP